MVKTKKKKKSNIPRSFLSTAELDEAMKDECEATGLSFSTLVRSILTQWLHFRGFKKRDLKPSAELLRERQK